jgi:hexosaminidase
VPLNKLSLANESLLLRPIAIIDGSDGAWKCHNSRLSQHKIGDPLDKDITVNRVCDDELNNPEFDSFVIKIDKDGVEINADSDRSILYAIRLTGQLSEIFHGVIPSGLIRDGAALQDRGYMLDVSRGRIPERAEFIRLLDYLCLLRFNHLELYTEHTFAYKNHETVWKGWSPLTADDIRYLDYEAKCRGIELIPNQNSFGHMKEWLEHKEYRHLAEAPDGFDDPWGNRRHYPFSLTPAKPEVFSLLSELYDELLPNFESDRFNVGLDETFDLGQGQSRGICDKMGKGQVYLDYLLRVHELVKKRDHKMLFWGDIVQNHPEIVKKLPENVTAIEWGYENDHDFDKRCRILSDYKISFLNAPGTSLWNTAAGRYKNACENIDRAIEASDSFNGSGILLTDWGDNGHIPPPDLAWPVLAYGAARAWMGTNMEISDPVLWFCKYYLKADSEMLPPVVEVYKILSSLDELADSKVMNGSILGTGLFSFDTLNGKGLLEGFSIKNITPYRININKAEMMLSEIQCDNNENMKEWIDSLSFSILFADYALDALELHKNTGNLKGFQSKSKKMIKKHKDLWHRNYRPGGYEFSRSFLTKAADFFNAESGDKNG